jgi:maltose O-acetyltransferase
MGLSRILRAVRVYIEDILIAVQSSAVIPIFFRKYLLQCIGVSTGKACYFNSNIRFHRVNVSFGERCIVAHGAFFDASGEIQIGDHVAIAAWVVVLSATHEIMPSTFRRDHAQVSLLTTVIERGCWIGARAVILPGVRVGEGCVIAAGAVVNQDCLPNGLYAGVPAKRVKDLPVEVRVPFLNGAPQY